MGVVLRFPKVVLDRQSARRDRIQRYRAMFAASYGYDSTLSRADIGDIIDDAQLLGDDAILSAMWIEQSMPSFATDRWAELHHGC